MREFVIGQYENVPEAFCRKLESKSVSGDLWDKLNARLLERISPRWLMKPVAESERGVRNGYEMGEFG